MVNRHYRAEQRVAKYNGFGTDFRRLTAAPLVGLAGGYLRFPTLAAKSISQPEMYNPGIRMPEGLSEPCQRLTLKQVVTGSLSVPSSSVE